MKPDSSGFFDFGDFSAEDFSPVKIEPPSKPLDEMTELELRNELVIRRMQVKKEKAWQEEIGYKNDTRLITLAEMYVEAQKYYSEFNKDLRERIDSDQYKPVLILGNQKW